MDNSMGFTVSDAGTDDDDGEKAPPQRERIIDAVLSAGVAFWRDSDGNAFAMVPVDPLDVEGGPVAHYRVRGRRFALICRQLFGAANKIKGKTGIRPGGVSDTAMNEAIPAFEAIALTMPSRQPGVRLLGSRGTIWIDLGDDTFRAIHVTAGGWTVEKRADASLIRPDGLRPLPLPVHAGEALGRLHGLLNLPSDDEGKTSFQLVVAWLTAALYPAGPYPVLAIDGEQGSGKTIFCRMLRRLVDPNAADLRAMPRNEDDLLIAALNGRMVALDNVSFIDAAMADALCRVATGSGFSKRELYTNLNETIVSVCRPVLLNGIPSLLARGDLADRSIAVTLPPIPDDKRQPEMEVWAAFKAAAPGILALLLDGLVMALQRLPTLQLAQLPRMADFARLACAAAPAFGWTEADILTALDANRVASVQTVMEADPIAEAIRAVLSESSDHWEGTASQLLEMVNAQVAPEVKNERGWPRDAARLSGRLKRVAPALRRVGVEIDTVREGRAGTRKLILREVPENGRLASAASEASAGFSVNGLRPTVTPTIPSAGPAASAADASADAGIWRPVSTNELKSLATDAADSADAESPSLSGLDGTADADEVIL